MNKEVKCVGIFGAIFGHKYRARTTEHIGPCSVTPNGAYAIWATTDSMLDKYRERETRYHGDVCARCGKIVNNP